MSKSLVKQGNKCQAWSHGVRWELYRMYSYVSAQMEAE